MNAKNEEENASSYKNKLHEVPLLNTSVEII